MIGLEFFMVVFGRRFKDLMRCLVWFWGKCGLVFGFKLYNVFNGIDFGECIVLMEIVREKRRNEYKYYMIIECFMV